jgi:GNAT superfamily N-acetyltransferase
VSSGLGAGEAAQAETGSEGPAPPGSLRDLLERVSTAFMLDWLSVKEGVELVRVGDAIAALSRSEPELDFVNRIYGTPPSLAEALAPYRERGLRPWLELAPDAEELERELEQAGAERFDDHVVLTGPSEAPEPELNVCEVEPALFARTFVRAVGAPDDARISIERWNARLYVAFVDGEPAGAGALSILDGVGHLANMATIPELRCRGAQTALIRRRIRDAAAAGCTLVSTGTSDGTSRRNLERAGLRAAYAKSAWRASK